jgi:2-oxoglutarate dehydrogenase E2 component (dihydrolipoamide succinyltransferase)
MRPLLPALAGAVLVAAATVWTPLPGPQDAAGADPAADPAPAPGAARPQAAVTASPALAFVKFAPFAAGGAAAAGAAPRPGPPQLVGLAGAGRARTAYIMDAGEPLRARVGDKVGEWRLAAIGPHSVTLRAGGKSLQLAFYGPRSEPAPPAAPDAAAPPAAAPPAAAPAPVAPAPLQSHAPEPASAPAPRGHGGGKRYWVGAPGSAPPGFTVLPPGQLPPQ